MGKEVWLALPAYYDDSREEERIGVEVWSLLHAFPPSLIRRQTLSLFFAQENESGIRQKKDVFINGLFNHSSEWVFHFSYSVRSSVSSGEIPFFLPTWRRAGGLQCGQFSG